MCVTRLPHHTLFDQRSRFSHGYALVPLVTLLYGRALIRCRWDGRSKWDAVMKKVYEKRLAKKAQSLQSITAICIPTSSGKISLGNGCGNGGGTPKSEL